MWTVLLFVFQAVVRELFSQFGCVQSVELRDHPGSVQESVPKLSKFFRPAEKTVGAVFLLSNIHTTSASSVRVFDLSVCLSTSSRVSKLDMLCSKTPPV